MSQTILGVDIGSSKICSIIAEVKDGIPQIIGTGTQKSQGIKKGVIVNIEQASRAIKNSIEDAKRISGIEGASKAIVSISGAYTKSVNSSGVVNIPGSEIGIKEIGRALETALYNASIPSEYEVIHVLPYKFKLDDQDSIEDPMGMSGARLEIFVHIVTVQKTSLDNLKKSVRLAGVEIENVVLSAYAASIAVLSDDEKSLGAACIDIGGSTCELMIYEGNSMRYNDFLGVGSHHITSDLALVLNTHIGAAEAVKIKYGDLFTQTSDEEESQKIEVPSIGPDGAKHFIYLSNAQEVINARVIETLTILSKSIERSGLRDQLSSVVLTGGMTNLAGITAIAEAIFHPIKPRIGKPIETIGLFDELKNPSSSVAIGLIWYGAGKYTNYEKDSEKNIRYKKDRVSTQSSGLNYGQQRGFMSADLTNLKEELTKNDSKVQKKDIIEDIDSAKSNKITNFFTQLASKLF